MVIIGTPRVDEMSEYFMADGEIAFKLQQANFHPKYVDEDYVYYFKLNNKLKKYLERFD